MIDHENKPILDEVQARLHAVEIAQQEQAGTIAAIELEQRRRTGALVDVAQVVAQNYSALSSSSQKNFEISKAADERVQIVEQRVEALHTRLDRTEGEEIDFRASCLRAFGELGATTAVAEHEQRVKARTAATTAAALATTPRRRTVAWHIEEASARLSRHLGLLTVLGFGTVFAILYLHLCGVAVKGVP